MANEGGSSSGLIWVLVGCAALLVAGLCGLTGVGIWLVYSRGGLPGVSTDEPPIFVGDGGVGPGVVDAPRRVAARVSRVSGSTPITVGAECSFDVQRIPNQDGASYQCRTQIVCGGRLVYGGPQAGYFPCQLDGSRNVVGQDQQTTSQDGDAAMRIDTNSRVLSVRDDAAGPGGEYTVEAEITSIQ